MTGTATILRRTITTTDNGPETTWATVGANVPCWIYEVTPVTATVGAVSGAIDLAEVFSIRAVDAHVSLDHIETDFHSSYLAVVSHWSFVAQPKVAGGTDRSSAAVAGARYRGCPYKTNDS